MIEMSVMQLVAIVTAVASVSACAGVLVGCVCGAITNGGEMINLGQRVRDIVTGFEGIATSRVEFLNGCVQYAVTPSECIDGKRPDGEYFDVSQLEIVDDGITTQRKARDTGGPTPLGTPTQYR